jgi:hypothetical protein
VCAQGLEYEIDGLGFASANDNFLALRPVGLVPGGQCIGARGYAGNANAPSAPVT